MKSHATKAHTLLPEAERTAQVRRRQWCVVRVNDDGREQVVNRGMHPIAAEKVAGALRDQMTDREVGQGWNYMPRPERKYIDGGEAQSATLTARNTDRKVTAAAKLQGRSAQPGGEAPACQGGLSGPFGSPGRNRVVAAPLPVSRRRLQS